jgi:type IV pilus assembly protein PilB
MALPLILADPQHLATLLELRTRTGLRIGELLVASGQVTQAMVDAAVAAQAAAGTGARLGDVLVSMGALTQADFDEFLEQRTGTPLIDVRRYPLNPSAISAMPSAAAHMYSCLPVDIVPAGLVVAFADSPKADQLAGLRFAAGHNIIAFRASNRELLKTLIGRHYVSAANTFVKPAFKQSSSRQPLAANSVAGIFQAVLAYALTHGASDIHMRPQLDGSRKVLVRVDGLFRHVQDVAALEVPGLQRYLEVLAGIDFMSRSPSKEGRLALEHDGRHIDLRVSIIAGPTGSSVVLRVLDPMRFPASLDALTLPKPLLRALAGVLKRPHGLLVAVGPTGSGKTTTLYTLLKELHAHNLHVVTVEDPVEYRLDGINQFETNDFGSLLPKLLRHDPDVVMVGELRDEKTTSMAVNAALTGHLVLSTVHANDSASTVHRLLGMGAPLHLLTSSLAGILSQRLVRLTCPSCVGAGCEECGRTGYQGRTLVAELAKPRKELAHLGAMPSHEDISRNLEFMGGITLDNSILSMAQSGLTTWDEAASLVSDPRLLPLKMRQALGYDSDSDPELQQFAVSRDRPGH